MSEIAAIIDTDPQVARAQNVLVVGQRYSIQNQGSRSVNFSIRPGQPDINGPRVKVYPGREREFTLEGEEQLWAWGEPHGDVVFVEVS